MPDEPKDWVELRVHGVSGTPPESMLGTPHVEQIAGDDYSRYFTTDPTPTDRELEGYHWGRFTSGTWRHALTLLFLPFGMVNAAPFMLPRGAGPLRAIALALFRLLGLLLTGLFSFALGLILVDLIGWRWSPSSNLLDGFSTGTVLPVTVLLAAAGMGLLSVLNKPGFIRTPVLVDDPGPVAETELRRDLYRPNVGSRLLRRLHLATGLAVIALLADLARTGTDPEDDGGPLRVAVLLVLLVIVVMVLLMGDPTRTSPRDEPATSTTDKLRRAAGIPAVLLATVALLLEAVLVSGVDDLRDPPDGVPAEALARLVRFDHVADGLMLLGLAVLGALAAITVLPLLWHHRRDRPVGDQVSFRPYAWGLTPYLLSSLATFVAIGFSAAAATTVASTLEINADDPSGEDVKVGSTLMLDRVAYAWGLTVILIVLMGVAVGIWYLATRQSFLESVDRQFWNDNDDADVSSLPAGWRNRVARAMFVARLKNALPAIVITFVVVGIAISTVQGLETGWIGGDADTPVWSGIGWLSNPRGTTWSIFVINLGAWTLVAGAGAIVALSRGALKNSGLRRGINVVWDIFGFWPHVAHPFGPEPYSRWTVMELTNRIRYHLGRRPGSPTPAVVIGPHSQGTVITVAALLLLTQEERDRVALLTCGSQLRVIYPRAFPAYFNLALNKRLFEELGGRWVNLYRTTDPLAGPVLSWGHTESESRHLPLGANDDGTAQNDTRPGGRHRTRLSGNDWRLIDPIPSDPQAMTGPVAAIHGHHDYWGDPEWKKALAFLRSDQPKPQE